ncbi:MAG TPA: thioesterase family protein [Polyangiales bacterium]
MDSRTSSIETALTLVASARGHSAEVPASWSQGRATYGGLVGGLLARAAGVEVPAERALRSALIDFIAPVAAGPVHLEARVLRAGRTLTHVEARLVQDEEVAAVFTGAYGSPRSTSLRVQGAPPAAAPHWNDLPRLPYIEGAMPRFTQHFEYRVTPGQQLFSGAARGHISGYVRHVEGGPRDAAGILGLMDAWPPAFMPTLQRPAVASTVTWMVDFTEELPARGAETGAYYRYEAELLAGGAGYASCDARMWSDSGQLVAISRQLVAEFS